MTQFLKNNVAWILTHFAAIIMAIYLIIEPGSFKPITTYSGYFAVSFLVLVLALHPLKKFLKFDFILKLNRYRQEIGVACFTYSLIHLTCFVIKRGAFSKVVPFLLHPALIPVFFVAFPIFTIMAITSNKFSMRKMTMPKWNSLHKKVYIAEVAVIIHMVVMGEKFWALILFGPLIALQWARKYFAN